MTELRLPEVLLENFRIGSKFDGETLRLTFSGNADMDARASLAAFLERLQALVLEHRVRRVSCDLSELYFMNSACFKCFVVWINAVAALNVLQQYTVEFVRNRKLPWQARSLESLRYFGPAIVFLAASG